MATKITTEEELKLKEAFKDKKFASLFMDYMKELEDPEIRRQQEEYFASLEVEGSAFVKPDLSFSIMTKIPDALKSKYFDKADVLLNICSCERIQDAHAGKNGVWNFPNACSPPRLEVLDGITVAAVDVVFGKQTVSFEQNVRLQTDLAIVALKVSGIPNPSIFDCKFYSKNTACISPRMIRIKKAPEKKTDISGMRKSTTKRFSTSEIVQNNLRQKQLQEEYEKENRYNIHHLNSSIRL